MDSYNKFNFVRDGAECKLPPGFRFQPTDAEIVFQYLARKTFSLPLPASVIPEIDNIFGLDPWELPAGDSEQDRYFFSNKEMCHRNTASRASRATCGGHWRVTGSCKQITACSKRMPIMGIRKTLVFYKGKSPRASTKTDWYMHVDCIALSGNTAASVNPHQKKNCKGSLIHIGNWILCHVFSKKRSIISGTDDSDSTRNYDSVLEDISSDADSCSASSSSSSLNSDSSVLSEVSSTSTTATGDQSSSSNF